MKKIIYSTISSLVLFSCSITVNQPSDDVNKNTTETKTPTVVEKKNNTVSTTTTSTTSNTNTTNTDKNNAIKPLQMPELTLKNKDIAYLGNVFKLNADFKDENGNGSNDVTWKSSNEQIGKVEKDNFLHAISLGKITLTATSNRYPTISKSFELTIKEKEIKSIIVKSRKDGYVIAKTGEYKSQFNFDNRIESQDSFQAEVEYLDGTKTEQVMWESNGNNVISVDNGVIKGLTYGAVDINIYNPDNKSQNVVFRANFVENLFNRKIECSNDISNLPKYSSFYTDPEINVKATFTGKVFDSLGRPVDNAIITAKSIHPCVVWQGEAQQTQSGSYVFRNAPVGVKIEIIVRKDGLTTRVRTEILKPNLMGDPNVNKFDFGRGNEINGTDPNNLYAMQVL